MSQQNSDYQYLVNTTLSTPTDKYKWREFRLISLLGSGGEGAVFKAKPKNSQYNQEIALKLQKNMKPPESEFIEDLIKHQEEFDNDPTQCSGIITIFEKFQYQNQHVLLMELGEKDLYEFLKTKKDISINERFNICIDLFKPIQYLHQKKLFHRDIKPENFIFVKKKFKLIDFGLIKRADSQLERTKGIGSLYYQAPELIQLRNDYNEKVDSWALACVLYEVLSGESLIKSESEIEIRKEIKEFENHQANYFKKIDQLQIHQDCQATIKKMLETDPNKRCSISEASQVFEKHKIVLKSDQTFLIPSQVQNQDYQVSSKHNNFFQTQSQTTYQPSTNFQNKQISSFQQTQQYQQTQQQQIILKNQQQYLQAPQSKSLEQMAQEIITLILSLQNQPQITNQEILNQNQNNENKMEFLFQNAEKDLLNALKLNQGNMKKKIQELEDQIKEQEDLKQQNIQLQDQVKEQENMKKKIQELEDQIKEQEDLKQQNIQLQDQVKEQENMKKKIKELEDQIKEYEQQLQKNKEKDEQIEQLEQFSQQGQKQYNQLRSNSQEEAINQQQSDQSNQDFQQNIF